jgi:hypothetical protein
MSRNRLHRLIKKLHPKRQKEPRKTIENFWTSETGTGQQVAQLLDCYMMMKNHHHLFGAV